MAAKKPAKGKKKLAKKDMKKTKGGITFGIGNLNPISPQGSSSAFGAAGQSQSSPGTLNCVNTYKP